MTNNASERAGRSGLERMLLGTLLTLLGAAAAGCGGGGGGHQSQGGVAVSAIAPASGPFIGGQPVTIHGLRFANAGGDANAVEIGGRPCTDVTTLDDGTITCVTPAGTPGMLVDVVVHTPRGVGRLDDAYRYFDAVPVRSDVNGDGVADLVVAAPLDDTGGTDAGAVFVFFGSAAATGLVDRSAASPDVRLLGQHAGDRFGASVACGDVDGDGKDDLVIGAALCDAGAVADAGSVYVFRGPFATGATIPALAANVRLAGESEIAGDRFGTVVRLGDVDGDGTLDVAAAAPQHDSVDPALDPEALDRGCVYFFKGGVALGSRSADAADRKLEGPARSDRLGAAFAFGDFDGDGVGELVVSCPKHDPWTPQLQVDAGVVYVLHADATLQNGSIDVAPMQFTGEAAGDEFGTTLAAGDVDGDGIDDLIVGTPYNDWYESDGGRVYVFRGAAAFASREARLADVKLSGMATHNSFGQALCVTDLDGDGIDDLLVGAPHASWLNDGNGRVYLFYGGPALADDVAVSADASFAGENVQDEQLGSALSVTDLNGDHVADLVLGAPRHAFGAGRAYLFLSPASGQHVASTADVQFAGVGNEGLFSAAIADGQ